MFEGVEESQALRLEGHRQRNGTKIQGQTERVRCKDREVISSEYKDTKRDRETETLL